MNEESVFEKRVRAEIYEITMREATPPLAARVAAALNATPREVLGAFASLAERHMLVMQPGSGEILMAGPYSAVPTPFRVVASEWKAYGNCIWDALGIAAMSNSDIDIDTSCGDCGTAMHVSVRGERVEGDGIIHFALPARLWWENVVFT